MNGVNTCSQSIVLYKVTFNESTLTQSALFGGNPMIGYIFVYERVRWYREWRSPQHLFSSFHVSYKIHLPKWARCIHVLQSGKFTTRIDYKYLLKLIISIWFRLYSLFPFQDNTIKTVELTPLSKEVSHYGTHWA